MEDEALLEAQLGQEVQFTQEQIATVDSSIGLARDIMNMNPALMEGAVFSSKRSDFLASGGTITQTTNKDYDPSKDPTIDHTNCDICALAALCLQKQAADSDLLTTTTESSNNAQMEKLKSELEGTYVKGKKIPDSESFMNKRDESPSVEDGATSRQQETSIEGNKIKTLTTNSQETQTTNPSERIIPPHLQKKMTAQKTETSQTISEPKENVSNRKSATKSLQETTAHSSEPELPDVDKPPTRTIPDHIAKMVNQAAIDGSKEEASQPQDREKEIPPVENLAPEISTPKERIIPPHIQQMMREKTQQTRNAQPDTQPVPPVAEKPSSPPVEPTNSRSQTEEQQKHQEDRATVSTVTESKPTPDVNENSSRSINHQETQQRRPESKPTPTYESNAEVKLAETVEHNSQNTHVAPEPPSNRSKPKQTRPSGPPPSDRSTVASKKQPQQKSDIRKNDVIADKTHSLNNTEIPSNITKDSQAQTEATANPPKTYEVSDSKQSDAEEYRTVEQVVDNATQQRIERHKMRNTHESETSVASPPYLSQDTEVRLPQEQTNQPAYQEPAPPTPRQQDRFIEDNNRTDDNVTSLEQDIPIPAFGEEQPSSPVAEQATKADTSARQQSEVHTFIRPDNEPHVDSLEQTIPIPQVIREEDTPQSPMQETQSPEPISHETDHGANSDAPPISIPKTDAQSKSIEDTISNGDHTADTVTVEQAIPITDTLDSSESIPTVENKDIDQFPSGHTETLFSLDELTDESVNETVSLIQEDTTLDIPEAIEFTKDQEMPIEITSDPAEKIYEVVDRVLDDKTEEAREEMELTEVSEIAESINIELGTQTERSELENVQKFTEETPAESTDVILEATDLQQNGDPEVLVAEQQEIDTETIYISPVISEKIDEDVNEVVLDTFDEVGEETLVNNPAEDITPTFIPLEEDSFAQFLMELFSDQHEPKAVADNEVKITQQNEPELSDEGPQDTEDIPAVVETTVSVTSEVGEFIVPDEEIEVIPVEATEANLVDVIEELVQDQEIIPVMILALPVDEYTDPSQEIKDGQISPEVDNTPKEDKKFNILMLQQEEVISFILLIQQITDILAFLQNTNKETSFTTDMDFTNELDVSPEELKNDTFGKYDDTVVQTLFPLVQFMFFIQDLQIFIPQQVKKEDQLTTFA